MTPERLKFFRDLADELGWNPTNVPWSPWVAGLLRELLGELDALEKRVKELENAHVSDVPRA